MPVTKLQRAGGVLLVTDRQVDEGALGFAARVARALDAPMAYWIIVETLDEMRAALPLLRKETALLQETAPEVKAGLKRGLAAEILSGIGADDYELVILSFRGRRGLKKVFPRAEILSILHHGKVNFLVLWGRRMEVRKVLFCTGGSPYGQQAVEYGARLAAALEAPATLLYVTETEPGLFLGRRAKAPEMEEETKEALEKAVETLEDAGIQSTLKVRHGKVANEILTEAATGRHDLIVLGSHGMGGIRQVFLGAVSEEVVRRARVPVLVVRARERRTFWQRLLHLRS